GRATSEGRVAASCLTPRAVSPTIAAQGLRLAGNVNCRLRIGGGNVRDLTRLGRRLALVASLSALLLGSVLVGTAGAGSSNYVCSGLFQSIPPGSYGSVTVTGLCSIEGTVTISNGLTIASGAGLDAQGPDC